MCILKHYLSTRLPMTLMLSNNISLGFMDSGPLFMPHLTSIGVGFASTNNLYFIKFQFKLLWLKVKCIVLPLTISGNAFCEICQITES